MSTKKFDFWFLKCYIVSRFENLKKGGKDEFFKNELRLNRNSGCTRYCDYLTENNFRQRKFRKEGKMPVICNWPDCGYVFPQGQKVHDTCPACDRSPFKVINPETGEPFTYTEEFLLGKRWILQKADHYWSAFFLLCYSNFMGFLNKTSIKFVFSFLIILFFGIIILLITGNL